jgi:hypothetical protein
MKNFLFVFCLMMLGTAAHAEDMTRFAKNGFELSGAEYWPFKAAPFQYPADVLWGFKGEQMEGSQTPTAATPLAQACARQAYDKLSAFLATPNADLVKLHDLGATPYFYLWTDDYTAAPADMTPRANKMWHWNEGAKNYADGFWKWESHVDQHGVCFIPEDAQIAQQLSAILTTVLAHGLTPQ